MNFTRDEQSTGQPAMNREETSYEPYNNIAMVLSRSDSHPEEEEQTRIRYEVRNVKGPKSISKEISIATSTSLSQPIMTQDSYDNLNPRGVFENTLQLYKYSR